MTTLEIIVSILGALGVAEVIRLVVTKYFSKKQDKIVEQKDEFAVLRERLDYNEKELNRINQAQIKANRKISKMYSFLANVSKDTCAKENCPYRELIKIDYDAFDDTDTEVDNVSEQVTDDNE